MIDADDSSARHYLFGLLFMLVGAPLILGAVVLMNELSESPEKNQTKVATAIEIQKAPPPPPPPQVPKVKPKPRHEPHTPPRPSLAALAGAAGGIDLGLPGLALDDVGSTSGDLLATEGEVIHTSETVDKEPRPVEQSAPIFPNDLRRKGVEGYVLLSAFVNAQGVVEAAKVLESKPPGVFDDSALEAIRRWRFQPGEYKGEPVSVWIEQRITYRLRT